MKSWLIIGFLLHSGAAIAADALPKAMLGPWASEPASCADPSSELRMTIEPKVVLMYEVAHTIRRVARTSDGFWHVSGHSVTDDGRAPSSLDLKLVGDKLQIGKPDGQIYHRCAK